MPGWWDDDDDDGYDDLPVIVVRLWGRTFKDERGNWICDCRLFKLTERCPHISNYRPTDEITPLEKYL